MARESSATTFVMGNRFPWPDDTPPPPVEGAFETGAVYDSASRQECSFRKISALGVTLRGQVSKLPGDTVAVELGTGRRSAGKIVWVGGGEAGVSFNDPVDILTLINRSLISQPTERRKMPRVEIACPVHLKWRGSVELATMRNISAGGLQVEGDELPRAGTFVSIFLEGLIVPAGEIVWKKSNLAGIELFEDLSWTSLVPWVREMMRKNIP